MTGNPGAIPHWAHAHGPALCTADIRRHPGDFQVTEELGFEPSGDGEHDFLWVEKSGANTAWVGRQLARHAGVGSRDVGYAGLKDRHAVTKQWFSVRRPDRTGTDWGAFRADGVRILQTSRNRRKLRRGAHRANRFRIALRAPGIGDCASAVHERIARIRAHGVPNYFGPQRFGRDGGNIDLARQLHAGKALQREARGYALSAARSYLFNAILERRVRTGAWDRLLSGDIANLDASGSVFAVERLAPDLDERCRTMDIHPTATLWGRGAPLSTAEVARLENAVASAYPELASAVIDAGVDAASRSLRVRVENLECDVQTDVVWIEFRLTRGAFATAVIRELVSSAA